MLETLATLGAGACACGALALPFVLILGFVAVRLRRAGQRSISVAPPGFVPGPKQRRAQWWVGEIEGREAGFVPVLQRGRQGPGQGAGSGRMGLRLVLGVAQSPLGWLVAHHWGGRASTDSFEQAFGADQPGAVSPALRDALLTFVQTFEGGLRLRDRAGADVGFLPTAVLPDATVVLGHEFTGDIDDAQEVQRRFRALVRIAELVEAG